MSPIGQVFDVMPIPYADLVVTSVTPAATGSSGQTLNVTWSVKNQGIGITSTPSWNDTVSLASNPDGTGVVQHYVMPSSSKARFQRWYSAATQSSCSSSTRCQSRAG